MKAPAGGHGLYPGAVPLLNRELLVGREGDQRRLARLVKDRKVVELTAPSGMGKSSLLMAGLLPELESQGFTVAVLRDWSVLTQRDRQDQPDPLLLYVDAVAAAIAAAGINVPLDPLDPVASLEDLAAVHHDGLVLVFDQFEELLRLDPQVAHALLDVIVQVSQPDGISGLRHVLSLRSEYKESLSRVERSLPNHYWAWFNVGPVLDDDLPEVVRRPVEREGGGVDDTVVKTVLRAWSEARRQDDKVGLLHLQALLWVLAEEAGLASGEHLDSARAQHSDIYLASAEGRLSGSQSAAALPLKRYLDLRLTRLRDLESDPELGRDALYVTARYANQLSSAGYKLPRDADDLLEAAFTEFSSLGWSLTHVGNVRDGRESLPGNEGREGADLLSGRLADAGDAQALRELVRVFETSLRWLRDSSVVRITRDAQDLRIVTLVHDGFGVALNEWAEDVLRQPAAVLTSPVGFSGRSLLAEATVVGAVEGVVRAAKWPGCSVRGTAFSGVHFDRCVFKGAVFRGCTFDDVVFSSGDLSGTLFEECTFRNCVFEDVEVSTLTLKQPTLLGDGLLLRRCVGFGVFLTEVQSGRWSIEDCPRLTHVYVSTARPDEVGGRVERSTVAHLHVEGGFTTDEHSDLPYADTSPAPS